MIVLRCGIQDEDVAQIREITLSSGFFSAEEIAIAEEVALEGLKKGPVSGYEFIFADGCRQDASKTAGFACYGKIPGTADSFDLYWLAVHQKNRAQGIGRQLITMVETCVASRNGRKLFAETSSRDQYVSSRGFYRVCGYKEEARIKDYYQQGEDQVVFSKVLLGQDIFQLDSPDQDTLLHTQQHPIE